MLLYHIINLDFEVHWKMSILLQNIKFRAQNFFSSSKFQNVLRDVTIFIPTKNVVPKLYVKKFKTMWVLESILEESGRAWGHLGETLRSAAQCPRVSADNCASGVPGRREGETIIAEGGFAR